MGEEGGGVERKRARVHLVDGVERCLVSAIDLEVIGTCDHAAAVAAWPAVLDVTDDFSC